MRQFTQQQTVHGNSPLTETYPEAASQTFERGAPVVLTANQITECATPLTTSAGQLLGIAAMPANGAGASRYLGPSTNQPVQVWIADDNNLFGIQVTGGTANAGSPYQIVKTSGLWQLNAAAAGNFLVFFTYTETVTNQVIAVGKFLESSTQLGRTT